MSCPSEQILLTNVHIGNLQVFSARCHDAGKQVFVHVDMIGGFRPDRDGIRLLKNMYGVRGIFSHNSQILATAKKTGLVAIQRLLLMDSRSLERGLHILQDSRPDGIEVLPGVLAVRKATDIAAESGTTQLIAGGMIESGEQAKEVFDAGYQAITSSCKDLWNLRPTRA